MSRQKIERTSYGFTRMNFDSTDVFTTPHAAIIAKGAGIADGAHFLKRFNLTPAAAQQIVSELRTAGKIMAFFGVIATGLWAFFGEKSKSQSSS